MMTAQILRDKVAALAEARIENPAAQITITPAEALYLADVLDGAARLSSIDAEPALDATINRHIPAGRTTTALNVSWRTASELRAAGIRSIGDLLDCSETDLMRLPGVSHAALDEIFTEIRRSGLVLRREGRR